jgi:hypothetical protein
MRTRSLVISVILISALVLGLAVIAMAADPFVGTWKMNPAKSKTSYPTPKSFTIALTAQNNGLKAVEDIVMADGSAIHRTWAAKYDGMDYPVTAPDINAISLKKPNANTIDHVGKKNGKEVWSGRAIVSKDGKTFTNTVSGKDEKGQAYTETTIMEKQ